MSIFYTFMSIIFAVFTYFVSLDNGATKKNCWLVSLLMLLFWPLVMIVITAYLIILHTRKEKNIEDAAAEVVEDAEKDWTNLDEDHSTEAVEETEEKEETTE